MSSTASGRRGVPAVKFAVGGGAGKPGTRGSRKSKSPVSWLLGYVVLSLISFVIVMFMGLQSHPEWLNGLPLPKGLLRPRGEHDADLTRVVTQLVSLPPAAATQPTQTTTTATTMAAAIDNSPAMPALAAIAATPKPTTIPPFTEEFYKPKKKKKERRKDWQAEKAEQRAAEKAENEREFAFRQQEAKYVRVMPTAGKPEIKQNRRVVLDSSQFVPLMRPPGGPSGIAGSPRALIAAREVLGKHPLHTLLPLIEPIQPTSLQLRRRYNATTDTIEGALQWLTSTPQCRDMPIFLSMATMGDELYWQLIENFVYSMVKFGLSDCALVICVSDAACMQACKNSLFPCFDYRYTLTLPLPSVMEQIAAVKLYNIPKALQAGVDIFMLDLDVGFLGDPRHMVKVFKETPTIDVFVQQDYLFIMNRTKAGWKSWFTEPLPNIGLFLCRGNEKVFNVFDIAWKKYKTMTDSETKSNPGKDQNHVLEGMRIGRGTFGLRYAYFGNSSAALLDKIVQRYRSIELGGEAASHLLEHEHTLAMHTTCYEQSTKVMGLKATNAFWNPKYYDPLRPTITKQILFINDEQVLDEVRSLVYIAMHTKRAVITPNLLGNESSTEHGVTERYKGMAMWPGFRVTKFKRTEGRNDISVDVLEPAYYWRVQRDYDDAPEPVVVFFDPVKDKLTALIERIKALGTSAPRIILHTLRRDPGTSPAEATRRLAVWAQDSVGVYESYNVERARYDSMPSVKDIRNERGVQGLLLGMRNCGDIFGKLKGNRTCFQICD